MRPVLKTNDPVRLDFAQVVLTDAGIGSIVLDAHASVMDGSLGILPRRLMVADDDFRRAEQLLRDGLAPVDRAQGDTSEDRFLGGRVIVRQPLGGFRAGLDAVMLAAAVPADAGDEALELGAGAGTAALCLASRVLQCSIVGVEIDPALAAIANGNAEANGAASRVRFEEGDVFDLPQDLKRDFAHVFCNPPFHGEDGEVSPDAARDLALRDNGRLGDWMELGLKRTASGGSFTAIVRADRLGEALARLPDRGVMLFPLWPRAGEPAKRIVIQVRKAGRAAGELLPGLILHQSDSGYTPQAEAVLRDGASLALDSRRL